MKCLILVMLFSIYNQAGADTAPLDLYKTVPNKESKLIHTIKQDGSTLTINVKNDGTLIANPIYPIAVQFLGQSNYILEKDLCSYKILKSQETCSVVINQKNKKYFNFNIFPYSNNKQGTNIEIDGIKEFEEKSKIYDSVVKLNDLPIVERIGVGNYYDWIINIPEMDKIVTITCPASVYCELIDQKNTVTVRMYPKNEDYYDIKLYLSSSSKTYEQSLKFTALVRKPLKIEILPNIDFTYESTHPINLKLVATYSKGIPLTWEIPNHLISWDSEQVKNGMLYPIKKGEYEIFAHALGETNVSLKFKVVEVWPYGKETLEIKKGQVVELNDYIKDYENIIIHEQGTLLITAPHPWVFLGAKNKFINNGTISFKQKYSGDISTNFPNFDGSLSGKRWEKNSPNQDGIHGGNLYIQARELSGKGTFDLNPLKGNKGSLVIRYNDSNNLKINKDIDYFTEPISVAINNKKVIIDNTPILEKPSKYSSAFKGSVYYVQRYFYTAIIPFILLYIFLYGYIKKYKIQKDKPKTKQYLKELGWSIVSAGVINFIVAAFFTNVLSEKGWIKIYNNISDYSIVYYFFSFILILVLHDIYFYFTHRLLHYKWFYSHVHKIHHDSTNPTPLTALSFHPIEAFMHFMFVPLVCLIFPFHVHVIGFFLWTMLLFNVNGHNGFEYWPKWLRTGWRSKILNNSIHHNMHHEYFRCNYSLYFNILDRIFKTNHKDYDKKAADE